jgi:hypothetical protein
VLAGGVARHNKNSIIEQNITTERKVISNTEANFGKLKLIQDHQRSHGVPESQILNIR